VTLVAPETPELSTPIAPAVAEGAVALPPATQQAWLNALGQEWGKITWPTRWQLLNQLLVVLVVVALFSTLVWAIDQALRWVLLYVAPVT
jgi:preprotein translocase SecE subunit